MLGVRSIQSRSSSRALIEAELWPETDVLGHPAHRLGRGRLSTENQPYRVLDVFMTENPARVRNDIKTEYLACRGASLSVNNRNTEKGSNRHKFRRAG
jgi:hypothetical protein